MIDRPAHGQHRHGKDAPPLFVVPPRPDDTEGDIEEDRPTGLEDADDEEIVEGEIVEPGTELELADEDEFAGRLELLREAVENVIAHPYAQFTGRHLYYVASGGWIVLRRWWDSRTPARYERFLRAAELSGNQEAMQLWEERLSQFRQDRHDRRMDWLALPAEVAKAAPRFAIGLGGLLLAAGILQALADKRPAQVLAPFQAAGTAINIMATIAAVTWLPVLLGVPVAVMAALWAMGRRQATDPAWAATSSDADIDIEIDETTIARALAALRIQQITSYLKEGLPLQYIVTARREGRGTRAVIRLPAGVTAEMISRPARRAQLASGLFRAVKETWPTTGDEAGILDLWVADKGALAEGAGPYPLLEEGFADFFQGVPYGRTLKGDPLVAPMEGRNTIIGGIPDQGKSSAARVIVAGAMLDPTVELRIYVPDANYDFETFKPRCARYIMGAESDKIAAILADLQDLEEELQRRGELLVEHQEPEVTRELADKVPGLHPIVVLLEEAHVAIGHEKYGETIAQLLVDIVRLCRKRAVHVIVSTQAPTKDSMPRGVTRNCSNGVAFAVGDHHANDGLLGQGAYKAGHRATELIPGTDAGTALVKGFTGQRSVMVQAHFLSVRKGNDQVTPLVERSLAELERRGRPVPGSDRPQRTAAADRDLLEDLEEIVGHDPRRVNVVDLAGRLRGLAPHWGPYAKLNGAQLRAQLKAAGVRTINDSGIYVLDPADLHQAIADASTRDLDDDDF